jgi:hypothetical protein
MFLAAFQGTGYPFTTPQQIHDFEQMIGGKLPVD